VATDKLTFDFIHEGDFGGAHAAALGPGLDRKSFSPGSLKTLAAGKQHRA
jgi:hypothetical protein